MEQRHVERRLAAILAADVAGYSRLMGADEEGTLAQLKAHRRTLVDPKIKEHRGRIIKTTGDGVLVEFASAVDAVRCAVEVQRGMADRNAGVPQARRIEFRIGINLGDIIHDNNDIFGDGVNVAARLQALAEPGGICVSQGVRDPVRDKLGFTFEDMGEQTIKNIARPIPTFRVRFEGAEPEKRAAATFRPSRRLNVVAASVIGLVAACAVAAIAAGFWPRRAPLPIATQPAAAVASASLPLPDKPSIAVLPFTSIGGDAKQERLADGITEDVIADLSRYRDLFVIARNSVLSYKGKAVSVQQVGRELGVRYVLEGSIQTSGDRVRVTAQLIEAATDARVLSGRYDRPLQEFFDLQSEVTQRIAATLATAGVLFSEAANARRKPPASLQAYDYYVLSFELLNRQTNQTKEDILKAEELLKRVIDLDPKFARAWTSLAGVYDWEANLGLGQESPAVLIEKSKNAVLTAIALDPTDARAYAILGNEYGEVGDYDHAIPAFEQAYSLNPNDPSVLAFFGQQLTYVGRAKEGVEMIDRAFRLNPQHPGYYDLMVDPYYATGKYDQVIAMTRRNGGDISVWNQMTLAMTYAQLGRQAEAAAVVAELSRRFQDSSFERISSEFGGIPDQSTRAQYLDGAHKAGLRDCATEAELQKYPKMTHLALCDAKRATN